MSQKPLEPDQLCVGCDPAQFDFETTEELEELTYIIGQERAVAAVQFGIGIQRKGYNLFALGPSGTGKRTTITHYLERRAAESPVPWDWCYVDNFEDGHKPKALWLPPGQGIELRKDMEQLLEELGRSIPAAFEGEDYQTRRQESQEEFQEKQEEVEDMVLQELVELQKTHHLVDYLQGLLTFQESSLEVVLVQEVIIMEELLSLKM